MFYIHCTVERFTCTHHLPCGWVCWCLRSTLSVAHFVFSGDLSLFVHLRWFNLINWCFESSQPLGIISGLKETFIKRHIVERTNKAEIDRKNRVRKQSCRENLLSEIQLKGPEERNRHKNRIKRSGQARLIYVFDINHNIPTTWRWAHGDISDEKSCSSKREVKWSWCFRSLLSQFMALWFLLMFLNVMEDSCCGTSTIQLYLPVGAQKFAIWFVGLVKIQWMLH